MDSPAGNPGLGVMIRRLATPSAKRELQAGATLFRQGDDVREMFVVGSGKLRLQRHTVEGVRLTLQTARAGDLLAEASLFASNYHCDAVADEDCSVNAIARQPILDALTARPELARAVIAALCGQVIDLRTRLELRGIRSARQRVWQYLSLSAGPDRRIATPEPLKHMAEAVGLTPETLYRTLASLQREGVISRTPDMIRIMRRDPT